MKTILLTNDDGFFSRGITALRDLLAERFTVYLVAPDCEKSAISMALTLNHPLRVNRIDERTFAIDGTTSDCVNIALQRILPQPPDFIVSGMNLGENLSEDIFFSGTVGGAFSGHLYGVPALAVSLIAAVGNYQPADYQFEAGAAVTARVLDKLMESPRSDVIYNLNIPFPNNGRVAVTSLGNKRYRPDIIERVDPRGRTYYWIGTGMPQYQEVDGTDVWAVKNQYISISVIDYNLNSREEYARLAKEFAAFSVSSGIQDPAGVV